MFHVAYPDKPSMQVKSVATHVPTRFARVVFIMMDLLRKPVREALQVC